MMVYEFPSVDAVYDALRAGETGDYTDEQVHMWASAVSDALYDAGYVEWGGENYVYSGKARFDGFAEEVLWPTVAEYDDPARW